MEKPLKAYWDVIGRMDKYAILQNDEGVTSVMEATEEELPVGTVIEANESIISMNSLEEAQVSRIRKYVEEYYGT